MIIYLFILPYISFSLRYIKPISLFTTLDVIILKYDLYHTVSYYFL